MELVENPVDARADHMIEAASPQRVDAAYRCLVCGDDQRRMFEYQQHQYHRCASCGLVSTYGRKSCQWPVWERTVPQWDRVLITIYFNYTTYLRDANGQCHRKDKKSI